MPLQRIDRPSLRPHPFEGTFDAIVLDESHYEGSVANGSKLESNCGSAQRPKPQLWCQQVVSSWPAASANCNHKCSGFTFGLSSSAALFHASSKGRQQEVHKVILINFRCERTENSNYEIKRTPTRTHLTKHIL